MSVFLKPNTPFSLEEFKRVVFFKASLKASPSALQKLERSFQAFKKFLKEKGARVYGVHTGFGDLQRERAASASGQRQKHYIASHACCVGESFRDDEVRAMVYLRSRMLVKGFSGVRPSTWRRLLATLSSARLPRVPSQGSVGACGDLAPLAHVALSFTRGLPLDAFGPRDALALTNGTEASLAVSLISWLSAQELFEQATRAVALSLFAIEGKTEAWDKRLVNLKKHPVSRQLAVKLARYLGHYKNTGIPQDPYSFRAVPQCLGAALELHERSGEFLKREADSVTDNPIITSDSLVLHGANFHGIYVALAADGEAWALNLLAISSERRVANLLSGARGLPPMLQSLPAASGLMIAHVTQAALVSENKILAHPASADSIPTSANQEDVVPMAMGSALKLKRVLSNTARVVAIEALAAARAIRLRKRESELKGKTKLFGFYEDILQEAPRPITSENKSFSRNIESLAKRFLTIRKGN